MTTLDSASTYAYVAPFHAAFDATAAERKAISPNDLLPINLDVQVVATTVMRVASQLHTVRELAAAQLPGFSLANYDKVTSYAQALAYAQTAFLAASMPSDELPALADHGVKIREQLVSDASALAKRNLLDPRRLADLKRGPGYLNIASDLGVLVRMLRERWSDVAGKSAIQPGELDEAEQLFERMTLAYAARGAESATVNAASDDRVRAYTLLVKAYDQARRLAIFVRWDEHDAETYLPSLYAGRRGNRGAEGSDIPANAPNAAGAPVGGAAVPATTPLVSATPAAPAAHGSNGLPGGSPFADS